MLDHKCVQIFLKKYCKNHLAAKCLLLKSQSILSKRYLKCSILSLLKSRFIIMLLTFDFSKKSAFSKQNTAKRSLMLVFTIPRCNGDSKILFINMWSIYVALVFVALAVPFLTGKILFWKARFKKSQFIVFQE